MDSPFFPGEPPDPPGPLARFLPPLEHNAVGKALKAFQKPNLPLLDPFGASPRLVIETARGGHPVLVAVNNPVTRFVLLHSLKPFTLQQLQSGLSSLATAPKDDGRLEPFILELYRTRCGKCGEEADAEYFVWDREEGVPFLRAYVCQHCQHVAEEPTNEEDRQRALSYEDRGFAFSHALEQVAPVGDPDRNHAEMALNVYPGRTLYALVTIINKLQQLSLDPTALAAVQALLLSTLDASNALWGYPEGRIRPLQLVASPQYREINVWRALEQAVSEWDFDESPVDWQQWKPEKKLDPGVVYLHPGPIREVITNSTDLPPTQIVTVLPRPNQAFWTLSALWASWLWGKQIASPIKVALRRLRYDWAWHASALRTILRRLDPALTLDGSAIAFMPDAEPGFIAAALAAFDGAGFQLVDRSIRLAERQAFLRWRFLGETQSIIQPFNTKARIHSTCHAAIKNRGEPVRYMHPHMAAWSELAHQRQLQKLWEEDSPNPLAPITEMLHEVLQDRRTFAHISRGVEPESGRYWLSDVTEAGEPLADKVERIILEQLRSETPFSTLDMDQETCQQLQGLMTPDRRLVLACLNSYAIQDEKGAWVLRAEDMVEARLADCSETVKSLHDIGERLGFSVVGEDPVNWEDEQGRNAFTFRVRETATLGETFQLSVQTDPASFFEPGVDIFVVPGGRASLVAEKVRRDPRLRSWMESGVRVIKFRHVRRLSEETTLSRENLMERLGIDPPEREDPQLPLL
jgi:hypothetical protein